MNYEKGRFLLKKKKKVKESWKIVKAPSNDIKRSTVIDGKTDMQSISYIFTNKFLINNNQHN